MDYLAGQPAAFSADRSGASSPCSRGRVAAALPKRRVAWIGSNLHFAHMNVSYNSPTGTSAHQRHRAPTGPPSLTRTTRQSWSLKFRRTRKPRPPSRIGGRCGLHGSSGWFISSPFFSSLSDPDSPHTHNQTLPIFSCGTAPRRTIAGDQHQKPARVSISPPSLIALRAQQTAVCAQSATGGLDGPLAAR